MTTPESGPADALARLPPLMTFEAVEAAEIVLPVRLACAWHGLAWYPVERDADVLYGLTTRVVPAWRRFRLSEVMARYAGQPVLADAGHVPAPAADVPDVRLHHLLDLTPFLPSVVPGP